VASYRQSFPLRLQVVPAGLAPPAVLPFPPDDHNSAVCYLLFVVCCLLSAVCCLLSAVYCLLLLLKQNRNKTKPKNKKLLSVVCCMLSAETKLKLLSTEPKPN
jgi:hypothetical protein